MKQDTAIRSGHSVTKTDHLTAGLNYAPHAEALQVLTYISDEANLLSKDKDIKKFLEKVSEGTTTFRPRISSDGSKYIVTHGQRSEMGDLDRTLCISVSKQSVSRYLDGLAQAMAAALPDATTALFGEGLPHEVQEKM